MEILPLLCIVSVAFTGLTKGTGVLPDGPLNAAVGETVVFTTNLTSAENPVDSANWEFGDSKIFSFTSRNSTGAGYEGRITFFIYTGSLELRSLVPSDSGQYSVIIVRDEFLTGSTTLKVYVPVSNVAVTASSTDVAEFSSVRLSCSSSGSSLSFLWMNSSSEVTVSDRVQLTDGNSTLTIVNVTFYDQGPFMCHVFNPVSNGTSVPLNLTIIQKISGVSLTPSSNLTTEGNSVNLTCNAAGSIFKREWMRNDSVLILDDNIKLYEESRVLSFQPLKKTDTGEYSCNISNPLSSVKTKYIMVVNYGPENIKIEGPSQVAPEKSFTLKCHAHSTPPASYIWRLNGTEIHNSPVFTKNFSDFSDSGNYTCEAMNKITGNKLYTAHKLSVAVQVIPEILSGCSDGCIAGIVIAVLVVCGAAAGGGYYMYRKKNYTNRSSRRNTTTRTGGEGQDHTGYSSSQDVNYADVSFFRNKEGGIVQMQLQNETSEYAQVRVNNNPPAASSPPTYDAHMKRQAPQPGANGTDTYAQVQKT